MRPRSRSVRWRTWTRRSIWCTGWARGATYLRQDRRDPRDELRSLAARAAGVRRIVYLGGLGAADLSAAPRSRQEVGRILRESGVPTIEFRASIILGSGQRVVRDRARARRPAAGALHAALGSSRGPSRSRSRTCSRTSSLRSTASSRERGLRDRRPRPRLLRRPDARVRRQRGLRRLIVPRAGADAVALEPLARARHAGLRARRPRAGRKPAQRHRRPRPRALAAVLRPAARFGRGDRPRACRTRTASSPRPAGRTPRSRRGRRRGGRAALGWRARRLAQDRGRPPPRGVVRADPAHRR